MNISCPLCGEFIQERSHAYRKHKIKEKLFYEKYFPKNDLFTKEKIEFKNPEQYFQTDFNNRINLREFLKISSKEKGLEYLTDWLGKRKKLKNLIYAPGQFYLKTLTFPSISFIEKFYQKGTYEKICKDNNLIFSYNYYQPLNKNLRYSSIVCDTRENNLIKFDNLQLSKLEYGDYAPKPNKNQIYIERKSINDLLLTLSSGYERFIRELERVKQNKANLVILIEEKFQNLNSFNHLPHIHSKASPEFILHRCRDICQNFQENVQFLPVNGRKEARRIMELLFSLENPINSLDLMYLYDLDLLC